MVKCKRELGTNLVTPYGGVWIEISDQVGDPLPRQSRLMEACGLKFCRKRFCGGVGYVTPYGGVWIEMV